MVLNFLKSYFKFSKIYFKQFGDCKRNTLMVDGANGVGAIKILEMLKYLDGTLQIQLYNNGSADVLALNKDVILLKSY